MSFLVLFYVPCITPLVAGEPPPTSPQAAAEAAGERWPRPTEGAGEERGHGSHP